MSIEDVAFLKQKCIRQSYMFLVDSIDRNKKLYPDPSEYVVEFTEPFRNVFGIEIMDVSIPKTMTNIDYDNNKIYYYIDYSKTSNFVNITDNDYDKTMFNFISIEPGDYIITSLINQIKLTFFNNKIPINILSVSNPVELQNKIYFSCEYPFILDMQQSTMAEILGFDTYTKINEDRLYTYMSYNDLVGLEKLYHSIQVNDNYNIIKAPGMVYLLGHKYLIIKSPEIEEHLYRSLSYNKHNMGLAKVRINSYGYNDESMLFLKVPLREFHPIGKLSKMTLRFETHNGNLYDFKGVNHNIVFAIYYYEPMQEKIFEQSILNPEYKSNFLDYMYKQKEIEGESDDDENETFSRDNIDIYKYRQLEYSNENIEKLNRENAFKNKEKVDEKINFEKNLKQKLLKKDVVANRVENFRNHYDSKKQSSASDSSSYETEDSSD